MKYHKHKIYALLIMLTVVFSSWSQSEKQMVAIYTIDESGEGYAAFVGDFVTNAIVKRGEYVAVERTAQFLAELNKEQGFQRTGAVDDSQISRLGKNMGVQMVCAVKVGSIGNQLFISARLVDVETAALKSTARPVRFDQTNWEDMENACEAVTASMFGGRNPYSGGQSGRQGQGVGTLSRTHPAEPEMVYVQGGTFLMGCTAEQGTCDGDESPNHLVTVSDFYIGKYEVTQAQWRAVMGTSIRQQRDKGDSGWPIRGEGDNYPMYYVSWDEVQEFISRLNTLTGKRYRLPTEAEWEYAARGGNKSGNYRYSGSNFLEQVAWFSSNSGDSTHPVGTKSPNELGIYDMSGNVWEWCYDWYGGYGSASQNNPTGPASGSNRVGRGGSWYCGSSICRVANRDFSTPSNRGNILGFRLVLAR